MYFNYYNLSEEPFGVTPDSRFLYMGPQHREALASLLYGTVRDRGFLAMIAEPGMGKTSLLFHYLSQLGDKARTAFVFRTDCDSREFIRHVLLDLGVDPSGMDLPAMHDSLNRLLLEEARAGRRFVLVIDEAQNLDEETLESVRLLSNFETPWTKLMLIVLAGQPLLADHLAKPSLSQLRQRVSMVIRIEPFDHEQVSDYIDHRLSTAECKNRSLFTVGARKLIAEHCGGIPRNINNLCFNALSLGCALKRNTIDRDIILEVIADLDLESLGKKGVVVNRIEEGTNQATPTLPEVARKKSVSVGWFPRLAVASASLLTLSLPVGDVNHAEPRAVAVPTNVVASVSASLNPTGTFENAKPSIQQTVDFVQVAPGQTLYRLSVEKVGEYNGKVLEEIRKLNPGLSDPDHIEPGQQIHMPAVATLPESAGRSAEPSSPSPIAQAGSQ